MANGIETPRGSMTDHDLLVRLDERVNEIRITLYAHLKQHWALTLLVLGSALSAIGAVVLTFYGR